MNIFETTLGPNWKTTVHGIVAAVGSALAESFNKSDNPTLHLIGTAIAIYGLAGVGVSAKDSNVTHTIAGSVISASAAVPAAKEVVEDVEKAVKL